MIVPAQRRGACPALSAPMQTGDGLLARLNPVAGGLQPTALIGLCRAAVRHGNGIMEVTQRGSIQVRGLTPESARSLADDVNALGVAVRTGLPVETSPLAGLDPAETADPRPLAQAIRKAAESSGLSFRLAPKVSVIVDGGGRIDMDDLLADVRLTAVRQDDAQLWHLAIGGTAADARPVGPFAEAEACEAAVAFLGTIAELGREARGKDLKTPRLDGLRRGKEQEPGRLAARRSDLSGFAVFPLSNATRALGIALPFGSMPAEQIAAMAQAAADLGATEIRPAPHRMLLVLGLAATAADTVREQAAALGFVTDSTDPRLCIAACPGTPACASAHMETRMLAETVASRHPALLDGSFTLHVSGCAKGCAHPGAAVLTLAGGENGAGLVVNGTAAAQPSGYTAVDEASPALGRVAALVAKERRSGETAAACLARLGGARTAQAFAA